jgi:hypothetical protein
VQICVFHLRVKHWMPKLHWMHQRRFRLFLASLPRALHVQFKNVQVNSVPILLAQLQPARRFGQGLYTMVQPACSLSFTAAFGWLINILINYWHWWTGDWTENVCQAFFSLHIYVTRCIRNMIVRCNETYNVLPDAKANNNKLAFVVFNWAWSSLKSNKFQGP